MAGSLETRIMFLIIFLAVMWLLLSATGRGYLANFAEVIAEGPQVPDGAR